VPKVVDAVTGAPPVERPPTAAAHAAGLDVAVTIGFPEDLTGLSVDRLRACVASLSRAQSELEGHRFRLLGELNRRTNDRSVDVTEILRTDGGLTARQANRQNALAGRAQELAKPARLLASGHLSPNHFEQLGRAQQAHPQAFRTGQSNLIQHAQRISPDRFRHVISDWIARQDADDGTDRFERQYQNRYLTLRQLSTGMIGVRGDLDPEAGAKIQTVLEQVANDLWQAENRNARPASSSAQRLADALTQTLTHQGPHLLQGRGQPGRPVLHIALDYDELVSRLTGPCEFRPAEDSGEASGPEARLGAMPNKPPNPTDERVDSRWTQSPVASVKQLPGSPHGTSDRSPGALGHSLRAPGSFRFARTPPGDSHNRLSNLSASHTARDDLVADANPPTVSVANTRPSAFQTPPGGRSPAPGPPGASPVPPNAFGETHASPRAFGFHSPGTSTTGTTISPATIRRLACDAHIIPTVLGAKGVVLDQGRNVRTATTAQRSALIQRDKCCVFPGCDRPPNWCQAHHIRPWDHGGPTDLDNLALICSSHHHLVHEGKWTLRRQPDNSWTAEPPQHHKHPIPVCGLDP